jgi:4-hydroxy-2-oxoheptanedioate aldolase
MKQNNLKEKMRQGKTVYGMFLNSGSVIAAEIIGLSNFDFIVIDSEHGPTDVLDNREIIMAAEYRDVAPLVRIANRESESMLKMLDVGAHGIMVPRVNTKAEAERIAQAARYFPQGMRGVASARASDYGFMTFASYAAKANERTLVAVQCEDIACLEALDDIAATPGIDMIFIGPYDLSSSMGALGAVQYEHIEAVVSKVLEVTKRHGKFAGIFTKDSEEAAFYASLGFHFIIVSTDIGSFAGACRKLASSLGLDVSSDCSKY